MKHYLAPLEGITGYIYRNAYEKTFHNVDKYFTPFIVANKSRSLKTKELKDVLNYDMTEEEEKELASGNITKEEAINIINTIDNGQRTDKSLASARRFSHASLSQRENAEEG